MHADLVADATTLKEAEALHKIDIARRTKACGSLDKVHSSECTQASDWVTADHVQILVLKDAEKKAIPESAAEKSLCEKEPWNVKCWSPSFAPESCKWTGVGCTVDICWDHTSMDSIATKPAAGATADEISEYYWSQSCTWSDINEMHRNEVSQTTTVAEANALKAKDTKLRTKECTVANSYSKKCL